MNIQKTGDRLNTVFNSYGIPPKFINARFDNYIPANNGQQEALAKCKTFAKQNLINILTGQGLYIHCSTSGTGKTHLAVATLYEIVSSNVERFGIKCKANDFMMLEEIEFYRSYNGLYAGFINVTDLLITLQESYSGNEKAKNLATDMMDKAKKDDLVIFDDIGAMKPTEWVETQLYNLVDIRYRNKRAMIFTSNCSMDELEIRVGKRVVSRIFEITNGVYVTGPDYRKNRFTRTETS